MRRFLTEKEEGHTDSSMTEKLFTCAKCGAEGCMKEDRVFPQGCMTLKAEEDGVLADALREYEKADVLKMARAAAAVEAEYYCKAPRVEEIVHFARKMDYRKIGIATCAALIEETRIFARVLEGAGLTPYGVACKAGRVNKRKIGIPDEGQVHPGEFEPICNPVLQAMLLNEEGTDLNVIVGLCVGHDSLFIKYSEAPVTTLIAKDRVLAHNPAGALYMTKNFYKRLFEL